MKMDLGRIKSLCSELMAAVEAIESGGEEKKEEKPAAAKIADDEGDDVAMKTMGLKLAKYK